MELNEHNFYSANAEQAKLDKVDQYIYDLKLLKNYDDVCNFIVKNFGIIEKQQLFEYPELNKQIDIIYKEDAVEFCVAKNWTQYFGRGWRKIEKTSKE